MSHRARRLAALVVGGALAVMAAVGVLAQTGGPGDKVLSGEDIVIPAGTTVDHDLYAFGGTITVAGTIDGDLVAGAARVIIDGTVTGDVFAAASDVTVPGVIGGDLRSAAGQVTIRGRVGEDVAVAASRLVVDAGGVVGEDLLFTATDVTLDGDVAGGIFGSASDYDRRGTVGGREDVTRASRLDQPATDRTAALALDALRQYVVVLLFGLALLTFAPRLFRASVDRARAQPLVSAGAGVVTILGVVATLIVLVVVMVLVGLVFGRLDFGAIVAVDIVGTVLAALSLLFGLVVFSAFIADAIVGLAVGRLLSVADSSRWADVIRLAIGAALVVVLTSFPEVGGIVKLLVILVALGAFAGAVRDRRRQLPAAVPAPPAAA